MKNQDLYHLFMDELKDVYSAEKQIIDSLPKLVNLASAPDLKEALKNHLQETKHQVVRLEKIFKLLGEPVKSKKCEGMEGLLGEADEIVKDKSKSVVLDAGIISAAQKVEHYEIASYGTLKSFAKHLDLDSEIVDLLQETLNEEGGADKKLTKIADGSLFTSGVNKKAAALTLDELKPKTKNKASAAPKVTPRKVISKTISRVTPKKTISKKTNAKAKHTTKKAAAFPMKKKHKT